MIDAASYRSRVPSTVPVALGRQGRRDLHSFNDQFGNIDWQDADEIHQVITQEIPEKVRADQAYQNAMKHSDKQNARIEHDKALGRAVTALLVDHTELFKQFMDNDSFRKWLTDTVFNLTYEGPSAGKSGLHP